MNSAHIVEFIDEHGLAGISSAERERLEVHSAECADCAEALSAARFSGALLRARAETAKAVPPPFFDARVLNALRERQSTPNSRFWSFRRWWQASYGLVGAMIMLVAVFGGLTLFAPTNEIQADSSNYNLYSTDAVILSQRSAHEMTREQMIEVIYSDQGKR
jgi:anti-sigma factor RsiW